MAEEEGEGDEREDDDGRKEGEYEGDEDNVSVVGQGRIQKLLQHKEFWVVKHISREANCVIDRIAKMISTDTLVELLEATDSEKSNSIFDIVNLA
ncbi:hypothetical protein Goari_019786 [Gossypium aridum]|uniref:Uncharacterized protein n=1 Tax=Gossypium aridum TaxID=34290 RepID=A0A7J8WU70_GOSAI|nr:hypothetical protein [Gossypium aridum]